MAEAIRVGPGVMPVFGEDLLPQDDLDAILAWTQNVTTRSSPGGLAVGRGGPVNEGLIAWVVGIGMLGAVIYLLGEREGTTDLPEDVPGAPRDPSTDPGESTGADDGEDPAVDPSPDPAVDQGADRG